jgi:hypothetical protein
MLTILALEEAPLLPRRVLAILDSYSHLLTAFQNAMMERRWAMRFVMMDWLSKDAKATALELIQTLLALGET